MKKILTILLAVVVVFFVVLLDKDTIIKTSVEKGVEFVKGLKLNIGSLHVGIFKPIAHIKNLQLFNPSSFPDKTMVDMTEIYVNYNLPAIIGGKLHLPEVHLALKEFVVVKNAQGKLNLDALKSVQAQKEGKSTPKRISGNAPQIKIDVLKLSIGRVIYKDYSRGGVPDVKEFNINLNESYVNVDDPQALANLIVVKALMNTSISALTNFDLKGLEGTVGGVIASGQKAASRALSTVKEAGDQVTDTLKGLFKNPFSSEKQAE